MRNIILASSFFSSAATTLGFFLLNNIESLISGENPLLQLSQNMILVSLLFFSFASFSFCITYAGYLGFTYTVKDMTKYKIAIKKYFHHKCKEELPVTINTKRFGEIDPAKTQYLKFVVRYTMVCTVSYSLGMRFLYLLPSVGLWIAFGPYAMLVTTFFTIIALSIHDFI